MEKEINNTDKETAQQETTNMQKETTQKERTNTKEPCEVFLDGKETTEDIRENEKLAAASTEFAHRLEKQVIYRGMVFNKVGLGSLMLFKTSVLIHA